MGYSPWGCKEMDMTHDRERAHSHVCVLVTWSCLTLSDPVDYSSPGSSVHGIL